MVCPTWDELDKFLAEELSPIRRDSIQAHVPRLPSV